MQTTANANKCPPRRRAWACLTASVAVIFTLPVMTGEAAGAQPLSVASTWLLPREPKAVCCAPSPDFATLAMMHTNGDVEIWSTATRETQRRIAAQTKPADRLLSRSLVFSPDGQWLAILDGGPLRLVPAAGGTNEVVIGDARENTVRVSFSGDSRRLLVCGRTERVVSLPEGKPVGAFQAVVSGRAGRPVLRPLSQHGAPARPIKSRASALSPDGSEVTLGQTFWEVERWDVATGQCRAFVRLHSDPRLSTSHVVSALDYAPRSGQLVAVLDGNQWDVALAEPDGKWRTLLHQTPLGQKQTSPRRAIRGAFFTPDGKEIVLVAEKLELGKDPFEMLGARSAGAEVQFLDAATGALTRRLEGSSACFFSQAWLSADGRRLMVLQRSYTMTPRTHAERQAQHLRDADLAAALLTISLDREPGIGKP
jgi:WD40 repeat protein